jgi:hypothetical protein
MSFRPLITDSGTTRQLQVFSTLNVGAGIIGNDPAALAIGDNTTVVSVPGSLDVAGDLDVGGNIDVVGTSQFTQDATFDGNVTFGNADTDTVTFVAKVASDLIFAGSPAQYDISNVDAISAASASLSGALSADSASITAALSSGSASISGALSAGSASISGALSADSAAITAALSAGSASISGALSADSATIANALSAGATSVSTLDASGAVDIGGALDVAGTSTLGALSAAASTLASATITGNATVGGTFDVTGVTQLNDQLYVYAASQLGQTLFTGQVTANQSVTLNDTLAVSGATNMAAATLSGNLTVNGSALLNSTLSAGASTFDSVNVLNSLTANGTTSINSTLTVTGVSDFGAAASVAGDFDVGNDKAIISSAGYLTKYGDAAPQNGQVLIGDAADGRFEAATLTAGAGVVITNSGGGIEIAIDGSSAAATSVQINFNTNAVSEGDVAYVSGALTASPASAEGGSNVAYARALGICTDQAVAGKIAVAGVVENCNFMTAAQQGGLGLELGAPVFLSADFPGKMTTVAPTADGDVVAELGIIVQLNSIMGGAAAASVLWQPKSIVVI